MEKNQKQIHGSTLIPQNLMNLRYSCKHPKTSSFSLFPDQQESSHLDIFSLSSLSLDNYNNYNELQESPRSDGTETSGPIVPPSDRFFISPATSASLAGEFEYHHDDQLDMNLLNPMVEPSDRFFISTSSSASLADPTAQKHATSSPALTKPSLTYTANQQEATSSTGLAKSSCTTTSSSLASDSTCNANQQEATSASSTSSHDVALLDGVPFSTYSKDPYEDFKSSMHEMIDSCHVDKSQPLDWDFMEDLLFCYLELNERSVHRYIVKAFTDVAGKELKVMSFSGD